MSAGAKDVRVADLTIPSWTSRPARLDVSYDIPYLGGYSEDGLTVYLDRRLPRYLDAVDVWRFIWVHERTEKALIDQFGWDYQRAHAAATQVEHEAVRAYGINPAGYEDSLRPWIRSADHESVTRVPADLDLTPYEDERDRRVLRELGRAR
ncbi:MAG: hypothetical protein ACYDBH_22375 [Acidobacteriaceae bacterium]